MEASANDSLKVKNDSAKEETGAISIETFEFPTEIKECSCYFAKNKADLEAEKYIYVDDAGENAFTKINGERKAMKLLSSTSFEDDSEFLSKEIETPDYKISIKAKKVKGQEESLLFEGTMTVEKASGEKITIPVYGECAC